MQSASKRGKQILFEEPAITMLTHHVSQELWPPDPWYFPDAQLVQEEALPAEYLPLAQSVHDVTVPVAYWPDPHPVHEVAPAPAVFILWPLGQLEHPVTVPVAYWPDTHAVQDVAPEPVVSM